MPRPVQRQTDQLSAAESFTPFVEIPHDPEHSLEQLTTGLQSVKDGLPELVKNAKDHYHRLNILERADRQIVVLLSPDLRHLGVLDFAGATHDDFLKWVKWSRRSAEDNDGVEAGHGNGGKAFMVWGARREAFMLSVAGGLLTKMGFQNDRPESRFKPGYYQLGATEMKNIRADAGPTLERALMPFGLTAAQLPEEVRRVLATRQCFTLVHLDGVIDWESRRREALIAKIPHDLVHHAQAAQTVETCRVWVMRGASLLEEGLLNPQKLEPYPGVEGPGRLALPPMLKDPETGDMVPTGSGSADEKFLELNTSQKTLRLGASAALNVIRVRNARNVVANLSVASLAPMASSGFIYGTLRVPDLGPSHLTGADRQSLADTPLVRALRQWTADKCTELAREIQREQAAKYSDEDKEGASDALRRLRNLMREFLDPDSQTGRPPRPHGTIPQVIELEEGLDVLKFPTGTTVPLVFRAYEKDGTNLLPVRKPLLALVSEPPGAVTFSGSSITADSAGTYRIRLQTPNGAHQSRSLTVEVVDVTSMAAECPVTTLKQGERVKLRLTAEGSSGQPLEGLVYEMSVDQQDMGTVNRAGSFTAGGIPGTATVRIRYGQVPTATVEVTIGNEKVERPPSTQGDVPLLLLCGTQVPGREDFAPDERTHPPGPDFPTIIDFDPRFEGIVWLNPQSVESMRVRSSRGSTGMMGVNTRTFHEFLALKCFEVLRRLKVRQDMADRTVTATGFLEALSTAELEVAPFLNAAYGVVNRLVSGLPEEG